MRFPVYHNFPKANLLKNIGVVFMIIITLNGCKNQRGTALETQDHDITMQLMRLEEASSDDNTNTITYKARITPSKSLLNEKSADAKNAMIYRMDSCFYLQSGTKKIYASLVQPVANGVSGSYEFLLEFEQDPNYTHWDFIYKDRYLNHKKYSLKLN